MTIKLICAIIGLLIAAIGIGVWINLRKYVKQKGGELPLTEKNMITKTIILCACVIAANIIILIGIALSMI